ncbi:hypothetical protein VMCG_07040 [Cytospora schulzeri]|uniref:FAD-binding domain-containing protein n=1 Tax=Cytospora schulzeri TaxID=448051 RepID=A0A423W3U7_9PEZI|nr:hypothetical protein VMCG_07040 [Valsa malicola]
MAVPTTQPHPEPRGRNGDLASGNSSCPASTHGIKVSGNGVVPCVRQATSLEEHSTATSKSFGSGIKCYDVLIAGAGPAGLLLAVLLARNGLSEPSSLLCVEPRLHVTAAGHADGLHARSLEMFKLLGLYEELMKVSTEVSERARWAEVSSPSSEPGAPPLTTGPRMARVMRQKVALAPNARMKQLISIAQGQIERIMEEDLKKNATDALLRGFRVVDSRIDESCASHPVSVTIKDEAAGCAETQTRQVRCRYLVGADGAHSTVRKDFGIVMEGDSTNHVWGVVDFVTDTDFPDIRRLTTVQNSSGMAMIIPREKNLQGEWLTRFYVDMNDLELKRQKCTDVVQDPSQPETATILIKNQQRRSNITIHDIQRRLAEVFAPFRMAIKQGTEVDWSTAYAIGQRVASEFAKVDSDDVPRVFLVGDACHTHSPKLGQGMNVSMADSFNLAWKLTHAVTGTAADPKRLLKSYASERRLIAQQLIDLDRRWFSIQWADSERKKQPGYQDECVKLYQDVSGFTSGCGIEYGESVVVVGPDYKNTDSSSTLPVIRGTVENDGGLTPNSGMVKQGRRLLNISMMRLADGCQWDIHDSLVPDGAGFKILVFCGRDVLHRGSRSAQALQVVLDQVMPRFSSALLDTYVVAPEMVYPPNGPSAQLFSLAEYEVWTFLPAVMKREAEMKTLCLAKTGYDTYGVDLDMGAVIVVRPDGIVGLVEALNPQIVGSRLREFLGGLITALPLSMA